MIAFDSRATGMDLERIPTGDSEYQGKPALITEMQRARRGGDGRREEEDGGGRHERPSLLSGGCEDGEASIRRGARRPTTVRWTESGDSGGTGGE